MPYKFKEQSVFINEPFHEEIRFVSVPKITYPVNVVVPVLVVIDENLVSFFT
ncbi:MAG: hypothetical protein RE472_04215 [Thermoplasmatales archaeon]|nr:MAG: hypothetical protein RE472_04215 [Thermoplasmatales archaeon]